MMRKEKLHWSSRQRFGATRLLPVIAIVAAGGFVAVSARQSEPLVAQPTAPTFASDVAPIFYKNCTSCHRPGGLGPFSLLDYDSAKAYTGEIREAVETGYMPPWHADGPHGTFINDRRLASDEKQTILRWIDGGAKPGDLKALPQKPEYPGKWDIGTPDVIVSMPNAFVVPAAGTVEYQYFEVPTGFTEDKWVQALEVMPGAREVVHHVLVYAKVPPPPGAAAAGIAAMIARASAANAARSSTAGAAGGNTNSVTPPPAPAATTATAAPRAPQPPPLFVRKPQFDPPNQLRRQDLRNGPPLQMGALIGSTAPGTNSIVFPEGTALRLRAGTILTFQMHYTPHGHAMHDQTSMGFRFAKEMPDEEIRAAAFVNGAFTLKAGASNVAVPSELEVTQPVKIWGLLPHTHLRGTRWKYTLEKPDGTSEVVLDVPRYDFNWQTYYLFSTPLIIPAGGTLKSMAWYDNSATNKSNPDATKDVTWGDQTWEEMQYTGYLYSVPSRRLRSVPK